MDQLRKIRRHHWKEPFKISKTAKFESDNCLKRPKIQILKSREILQTMISPESVMVLLSCQFRVIHLLFWNPLWDSSSSGIGSGSGNDSSSGVVVVVARSSRKDDSIMQMAFRENFTL